MAKTITLRLKDDLYTLFKSMAEEDNRTIANFIETCVLRYLEQNQYVDEYEMDEIRNNVGLKRSLTRAHRDAKNLKGRFVE